MRKAYEVHVDKRDVTHSVIIMLFLESWRFRCGYRLTSTRVFCGLLNRLLTVLDMI